MRRPRHKLIAAVLAMVATFSANAVSLDEWITTAGLATDAGIAADALRENLGELHRYLDSEKEAQSFSPAEVAWICEALCRAALFDEAEGILLRALETVRGDDALPLPRGSVPAALAGIQAPPPSPYVFDAEAGAWLLAALRGYVEARPDRAGAALVARQWKTLVDMGDFLEGWRPGYDPEPLYTHLAETGNSGLKPQMIFSFYLGLSSAEKLSEVIGRRMPDTWPSRIRTLGGLIKSRALDRAHVVPLDAPFASYLNRRDSALAADAPVTVRVGEVEQFLDTVPVLPPDTWIAHPACGAALQFLRVSDALYAPVK